CRSCHLRARRPVRRFGELDGVDVILGGLGSENPVVELDRDGIPGATFRLRPRQGCEGIEILEAIKERERAVDEEDVQRMGRSLAEKRATSGTQISLPLPDEVSRADERVPYH